MAYRISFLTMLLAAGLAAPSLATDSDEKVRCETIASIGVATMTKEGVITLRIRSLAPGPIAAGVIQFTPGQAGYEEIKQHLGGISPGESKPIRPWC